MEPGEEKQNHVIKKIRKISLAMDKGEFWTIILIVSLLGVMVSGLAYLFFH